MDYHSLESLTNALQGQEAVISALPITGDHADVKANLLLVEAAAKTDVKRFIPSEFGTDTLNNEKTRTLPVFVGKVAVQDALKNEAATGGMTYTVVCTGPFLDWGMMSGFIMNLKRKSISLWDGGDRVFSAASLQTIGRAVAGVLKQLEPTKNRAVYVHDTATTLKKLAAMAKHATGADGWKESVVSIDEQLEIAWAEVKKDQPNPDNFVYTFLKASVWGEGFGGHYERPDNELFGIKEMSDAELQDLVNSLAKK